MIWLIVLFGIGWFFKVLLFDRPPKEPPISKSLTVAMKYGKLEVVVQYEANPIAPRVERAITLWAMDREERRATAAFQLELETELSRQFQNLIVVTSHITADPQEPEVPKRPSYEERLVGDMVKKKSAAVSVAREGGLDPAGIINGATLEIHQQRHAETVIRHIYHDPDKA